MPKKSDYFPAVKQDYPIFRKFMLETKVASISPMLLKDDRRRPEYIAQSPVELGWQGFPCRVDALHSKRRKGKYAFKLSAFHFSPEPVFRFDSHGSTHMNEEAGDGLPFRAVTTPHFHRIEPNGVMIAYKTPELESGDECERILRSPQLGMKYFCAQTNVCAQNGFPIQLQIDTNELDLSSEDPLVEAEFPTADPV